MIMPQRDRLEGWKFEEMEKPGWLSARLLSLFKVAKRHFIVACENDVCGSEKLQVRLILCLIRSWLKARVQGLGGHPSWSERVERLLQVTGFQIRR